MTNSLHLIFTSFALRRSGHCPIGLLIKHQVPFPAVASILQPGIRMRINHLNEKMLTILSRINFPVQSR